MDFQSIVTIAAGLALVSVVMAYWLAAHGMLMESRFGRTVFCCTVLSVGLWVFVSEIVPGGLRMLGASSFDLALLLVGAVLLTGAVAAFFDLVGWLRGEWRTPPPPFE